MHRSLMAELERGSSPHSRPGRSVVRGKPDSLNNPAASCGVSELGDEICLKGVTPECFYRGSSSEPAWIHASFMFTLRTLTPATPAHVAEARSSELVGNNAFQSP